MTRDLLQKKISEAPKTPGVYKFLDVNGKLLYIGKAKLLRNRVRSYFQSPDQLPVKNRLLVRRIRDVEFIITDSEAEALILENNLIKEFQPRYNVSLKDDKTFPYIRITNEPYPRIFVTRKIERDGSRYIGPFTEVGILKRVLKVLKENFRIRTCNYSLNDANVTAKKYPLCLDYHIHRCDGPCQGLISREEYNRIIDQAARFLKGRVDDVIREVKSQMEAAAAKLDFETAKLLRDRISVLQEYAGNAQKVEQAEVSDQDVIGIHHDDSLAAIVVMNVRDGKVLNQQRFRFTDELYSDKEEILRSFLEDYYLRQDDFPSQVLLPFEVEDLAGLTTWAENHGHRFNPVIPQRGKKSKLVRMVDRNAAFIVEEMKLERLKKRMDYIPHNIASLQRDLHLENPPKRMECFDISNIQGTDPVASMVCFIDGKPKKSEYRIFKIRIKETPDDFAMMKEAISRRYIRVREENLDRPDLIVVDGGKGQLNTAVAALQDAGLPDLPIISLAKRLEEVFIPGYGEAQNIPRTSSSLKLLQQIRDEAHRFAVSHHRKQRKKRTLGSSLDAVPGVGEGRRQQLLKHFGSVQQIKNASLEELEKVPGLPAKTAAAIHTFFNGENNTRSTD